MCCTGSSDEEDTSRRSPRGTSRPHPPPAPVPLGPGGGSAIFSGPSGGPGVPSGGGRPFYAGDPFGSGGGGGSSLHDHWKPLDGTTKRIRRLYCDTGFDLAVFPNGDVAGVTSSRNAYGNLEIESVGLNGEVKIRGLSTGFYVTMNSKGRVSAQPHADAAGTVWIETVIGQRVGFMSLLSLEYAHHGWYLAIRKSGKMKPGAETHQRFPQKAITFLPRIVGEISISQPS